MAVCQHSPRSIPIVVSRRPIASAARMSSAWRSPCSAPARMLLEPPPAAAAVTTQGVNQRRERLPATQTTRHILIHPLVCLRRWWLLARRIFGNDKVAAPLQRPPALKTVVEAVGWKLAACPLPVDGMHAVRTGQFHA